MHIEKFQTIVGMIIVWFGTVKQNNIAFLSIKTLIFVFDMHLTFPDEHDQKRRIRVSFHKIMIGTIVMSTPGRIKV